MARDSRHTRPFSSFFGFHLDGVGVTTSKIPVTNARAISALHWEASRCQSTKRLSWLPGVKLGYKHINNPLSPAASAAKPVAAAATAASVASVTASRSPPGCKNRFPLPACHLSGRPST